MKEYQSRIIDEKTELEEKIDRLKGFFGGEVFMNLHEEEQDRLHCQYQIMKAYSAILASRIKMF